MIEPGQRIYDDDGNPIPAGDPRLEVAPSKLTREQEEFLARPEVQEAERLWREWYEGGKKGPSPGENGIPTPEELEKE